MPNSRARKKPTNEEPGNANPPEGADEQDQGNPTTTTNKTKTLLKHARESMAEHATLGRLLAQ